MTALAGTSVELTSRSRLFRHALDLVEAATPEQCVEWPGKTRSGQYGRISLRDASGRMDHVLAHRAMYERFVGPIPAELALDHLCRNPPCCNPAHLQPVTNRENVRRGFGARFGYDANATCIAGHPRTEANTSIRPSGSVRCRRCHALREARRLRDYLTATAKPGTLPWIRLWHGEHFVRGAEVRVDGQRGTIWAGRNGLVLVRMWATETRRLVRPSDLIFPTT